jgi:hypothetical protein
MKTVFAATFLALTSCDGYELVKKDNKANTAALTAVVSNDFEGSVQYAFDLSVDGVSYSDIEQYYTEQAEGLKDKVSAAGYSVDSVEFVGKLGFADFIQDMTVFVSSSAGTQGKGSIDAQGNFSVSVPNPKSKDNLSFKVRATKRVQVLLINGGVTTKKLCYNFSAVEKDVVENPISLNTFKTDPTLYDCTQVDSGLAIPAATQVPVRQNIHIESDYIDTVWFKGNEFKVDVNGVRSSYMLSGVTLVSTGASEAVLESPEGFESITRIASRTETTHELTIGANRLIVKDLSGSASVVSVAHNNIVMKSFRVNGFGLSLLAASAADVFAVGRVAGANAWKMGKLDLDNNRFIPLADAPNILYNNAGAAVVGNVFVAVGGKQVSFVQIAE